MKNVLSLVFMVLLLISCEDVVEIDVPQTQARLSIDGLVRLDTSKEITIVQIKANLTNSFFSELNPAELNSISIINESYVASPMDTQELVLVEITPGLYEGSKNTNFFTQGELQLIIEHDNQRYIASTKFVPSVPLNSLTQGEGTLFSGNETEVEVAFDDNGDQDNYYLVDLDFGDYLVTEDEFYNGQTFRFSYFYDDGVEIGTEVQISLLGVDKTFYNYMNQLIVQAGGDQGPFQTPSATVRGNIINVTNTEDTPSFALGYFAICETFTENIIIE